MRLVVAAERKKKAKNVNWNMEVQGAMAASLWRRVAGDKKINKSTTMRRYDSAWSVPHPTTLGGSKQLHKLSRT